MLPFVVVLGQNLSGAVYSLLSRKLAVKLPHAQMQVAAVLFVITFLVAAPAAIIYGDVHLSSLIEWWPYLLLAGFTTSFSVSLLLLTFRHLDAAMGTLLTTLHIVLGVVGGMYVLGERMGLQEIVGGMIVLAAVGYALSVHVSKKERRNWTRGIMYAVASSLCFAVGVVIEKFLLGEMTVPSYVVWGLGMQCLAGVSFGVLLGWRHFGDVLKIKNAALLLSAGLVRTAMAVTFVFSLVVLKSLCIAVILAGIRPLFVAFLGAWFLNERRFLGRKVIASIVAAAGIAIMFWK
ncbi:MAG TPA: DMT family transporter [Nitrososphaera sp.]|nr:DMT family transporter [Nitrososphaera sp.]